MKGIVTLFFLNMVAFASFAQKAGEPLYVRLGYSATNIVVKEAIVPSINFFGYVFDPGKLLQAMALNLVFVKPSITAGFLTLRSLHFQVKK